MANIVFRVPINGKMAIYSSVVETVTWCDMTPGQCVDVLIAFKDWSVSKATEVVFDVCSLSAAATERLYKETLSNITTMNEPGGRKAVKEMLETPRCNKEEVSK